MNVRAVFVPVPLAAAPLTPAQEIAITALLTASPLSQGGSR
jgi:hypothetical protein